MRKIAQTAYSGPSGAADLGVTLALAGQKAGVPQTMAFWGVEKCPPDRLARCAAGGIPTEVFEKKYGADWRGQLRLGSWINRQKDADAFIAHYPASLVPLRRVFLGGRRPRMILVEHNSIFMKRPHHWVLSALAFWVCDGVVYLTNSYRDETRRKLGPFFRRKRATVIANGLDLDLYPSRDISAWRDDSKPFTFGMSGRMAAAKDYATLIDAFALLVKQVRLQPAGHAGGGSSFEASSVRLELAGDGQLRSTLEEQAQHLGIREQVSFLGHMAHAELLQRMAGWDAFVLSTQAETQPLALMEAMTIGLPCVASDVDGVKDLIVHGSNGLLARAEDPARLSQELARLVNNPTLCQQIARVGNKYIIDNFSSQSMWNNYHKFIDYINNK